MAENSVDDWEDVPVTGGADDWQDVGVEAPGLAESAIGGAAQGMTLGHADELTAGIGAVYDYLEGKAGGRGEISFSDAYQTRVDAIRRRDADLKAANPGMYKTAELAGAVAPAFVTGGASIASQGALRTGAAATGGGLAAGSGYSEGELGSGEHAFDTALGGALGAATFGAVKGAGAALSSKTGQAAKQKGKEVLDKLGVPDKLSEFAEQRAAKAATGQNKRALKAIAAKPGGIEGFGRKLLDDKIVKAGRSVSEIAKAAEKKREVAGEAIDEIFGKIDEQMPDAVDGKLIAQKMRSFAESKLKSPNDMSQYNNVIKQAEAFEEMGSFGLQQAQHFKNTYNFKPGQFGQADTLPQGVQNEMKRIVSKEMEESIQAFADIEGKGLRRLGEQYVGAKADYGVAAQASGDAAERAVGDLSNRFSSPSDIAAGGIVAMTSANPSTAVKAMQGIAVGAANKLARARGNSAAAVTVDKIAKMLKSAPAKLGPYAKALEAGAKRGQQSLGATHQILWRNDPKYRELFNGKQFDEEGMAMEQAAKTPPGVYNPEVKTSGKHAQQLLEARKRGGSNAVNATHYILMQTDPDYRAKFIKGQK